MSNKFTLFIPWFGCTCCSQHPSPAGVLPLDQGAPLVTRGWTQTLANRNRISPQFPAPRRLIGCYGRDLDDPMVVVLSAVATRLLEEGDEADWWKHAAESIKQRTASWKCSCSLRDRHRRGTVRFNPELASCTAVFVSVTKKNGVWLLRWGLLAYFSILVKYNLCGLFLI